MKVTREEKFTPITIVLETKEEADLMYKVLNYPTGIKPVETEAMWKKFIEVFHP